jgi:hypothetical protein
MAFKMAGKSYASHLPILFGALPVNTFPITYLLLSIAAVPAFFV